MDAVVKLFKAEAESGAAKGRKSARVIKDGKGAAGQGAAGQGAAGPVRAKPRAPKGDAAKGEVPAREAAAANAIPGVPASLKRPSREAAEAAVRTLLAYIGEDPAREGLLDTPQRVVKAYDEMFAGYGEDPEQLLERTFGEIGTFDDFVLLRDIPFHSHCEHHMVPFSGKAHVAYFPVERVVGLSKIARVVEIYARRLQTQEHLTSQIVTALETALRPRGVAVMLEAEHMCMSMRGITKEGVSTLTSQFTGIFRENPAEQVRFITLLRSRG